MMIELTFTPEIIEELTGVKRKLTQVKAFLKLNGFKYRKAGHVPGKECTEEKKKEQADFLENELKPRLKEVKKGKRAEILHGFKMSLTEITSRIKETLMQNLSLFEMLCLERRALEKPPDRNRPEHPELFPSFMF